MTYRDDLEAARMRRNALARELHEVRRHMVGYQELAVQEHALEQEIAQTAREIEQARARVALPLLSRVHVASPCKERWSDMSGDDHVRFCGRCAKNVYDLSSLTASQAEALLRERGESMCVRFFRRSDGTILTSDCPVGARRKSVWRRAATAAVASGVAAAGIALAGATIDDPAGATAGAPVSGEMSPPGGTGGELAEPDVSPAAWEQQEQLQEFSGGMGGSMDMREDPMDSISRKIERAHTRLAEATTGEERVAALQELKELRAEARKLEAERRASREINCLLSDDPDPRDC